MIYLRRTIRWTLLGLLLPISLNTIVYFGFISNYTRGVFSVEGFESQYYHGIYRYRVLGRELIRLTHDILDWLLRWSGMLEHGVVQKIESSARLLDSQATAAFYLSYFTVNTFFLCLYCLAHLWLVESNVLAIHRGNSNYLFLCNLLLVALSQYVVTPYDIPVYFFLILGISLILRHNARSMLLAGGIIAIGGLFRESITVLLAFTWALYTVRYGWRLHKAYLIPVALTLVYIAAYALLRLVHGSAVVVDQVLFPDNIDAQGAVGILFALVLFAFFALQYRRTEWRFILLFLFFALPYITAITIGGLPFEIRLFLPLLLVSSLVPYLRVPTQQVRQQHMADAAEVDLPGGDNTSAASTNA